MMRLLRALAWLRWRLLLNGMKTRRRDTLEQLARVVAALAPIMLALMLVPSTLTIAVAAGYGGYWMGREEMSSLLLVGGARFVLAGVTFAVLLAPLVRSVQGARISLTRLLLLPIPRRAMLLSELLSGLTDPWVVIVVPALLALPLGLLLAGAGSTGLVVLVASLAMLAALAGLGALGSYLTMLLFRRRRRAELLMLAMLVTLPLIGFVPGLLEERIEERERQEHEQERSWKKSRYEALAPWLSAGRVLPSELYGRALDRAAAGYPAGAAAPLGGLIAIAAGLCLGAAAAHRRLLEDPGGGSSRRSATASGAPRVALPGFGGPASVVAAVQIRTFLRTVRGKAAVFVIFAILLMMYMLLSDELREALPGWPPIGPLMLFTGGAFTFLALGPALLNQFAVAGAGLTLEALAPVSTRQLVLGKVLGCGLLGGVSLLLCLVASVAVAPGGHPWYWVAVMLGWLSSYLLLGPLAAAVSAVFPAHADLNKMGKAGNPHPLAGLIGLAATVAVMLPSLVLLLVCFIALRGPWITLIALVLWTALAAALAVPLVRGAARVVERRRENLLLVASGR